MMSCLFVFKLCFHQNKLCLKFVRVLNIIYHFFNYFILILVHVCFYFYFLYWTYFGARFGSSSEAQQQPNSNPTLTQQQTQVLPGLAPTSLHVFPFLHATAAPTVSSFPIPSCSYSPIAPDRTNLVGDHHCYAPSPCSSYPPCQTIHQPSLRLHAWLTSPSWFFPSSCKLLHITNSSRPAASMLLPPAVSSPSCTACNTRNSYQRVNVYFYS